MGYGFDSIIVDLDETGKPPEFYKAGWNDRNMKTPTHPHALFKIRSITKLYVAVAAAKLIKDKRLSLDTTLPVYFPELVVRIENADKITLQMMLHHRSGVPNFMDHPNYWQNPPKNKQ